jgi:membrane associated rhomboid family serine protease
VKRYANDIRRFLNKEFIPVTKGIIVLSVALFIVLNFLLLLRINLFDLFQLYTYRFYLRPWTLLTYPLVNHTLLSLIFGLLWLWYVGGSLERSWGGQTYGFFLGLATLVTGLAFALTSIFFGRIRVSGLWLPLTGITWAWAQLYPDRELLFWGLIPIKAEWLAWIQAAMMFYQYLTMGNLFYALSAVSSIAVVYLFAGRGPFARGIRYWAWTHNFSIKSWWQELRDKKRKKRLKIVK